MNNYFSRSFARGIYPGLVDYDFDLRKYIWNERDQLINLFTPKTFYIRKIRKNKRIHVNMKKIILDYLTIQRR